ncbi:uncharacterized protein LOC135222241 [Macrobrachium nipponense]|uniref:uncharacterized protein LOC135222241 n=1 Tax=Macrobrachium nipponense TaxID=159736 RepID=UPI0030C8018D
MGTTFHLIALILMAAMYLFAQVGAQMINKEPAEARPILSRSCGGQCTTFSGEAGFCRRNCQQGEIQAPGKCPSISQVPLPAISPVRPCVCCVRGDKLPVCMERFCTGGRRGESGTCRTECLEGETKIDGTCGQITEDEIAGACVCCGRDGKVVSLPLPTV